MPDSPSKAVFLSHASQDAEAAKRICDGLRSGGVEVWFDSDGGLEHGDEWDAKIRRQIKECVLFIPIISSSTQARHEGYFRIEWDLAAERARGFASGVPFILPIVIDETKETEALVPDRFRSVQWTRLQGGRVSSDFLGRFLKLWSHRTGVLSSEAAQAATVQAVPSGAGRSADRKRPSGTAWVVAAMAAAVACAAGWWLRSPRKPPQEPSAAPSAYSASQGVAPNAPDSRSVAVLSFENLSDEKENEYFSEGISDELLNVLAKIPGLHVAARTSSFYFKGKNATAQEIGARLGVANLVEGSVRRSGNSVRIAARLSRAATGEQLWSESYTRDLNDVFAVQTELAQTIVAQLRQQLGVSVAKGEIAAQVQAAEKGGTQDAEAHRLYLQGRFYLEATSLDNLNKAAGLLQRAVDLDPNYALAWASLSQAGGQINGFGVTKEDITRGMDLSRRAANRALELAPDLAAVHLAKADVQENEFDWKGAAESIRKAQQLDPGNSDVIQDAAILELTSGNVDRAVELGRQAEALDPVNPGIKVYLGFALCKKGLFKEAIAEFQEIQAMTPSNSWGYGGLAYALICEGDFDEAQRIAEQTNTEWLRLVEVSVAQWGRGKTAESDEALKRLISVYADVAAFQIAEGYAFRKDSDAAFEWLERAYRQRDPGLERIKCDFTFQKLHSDPRWDAFLRKLGLSEEQVEARAL
jgi:TolB-like protein/Tfp pilus assembly protein PilF